MPICEADPWRRQYIADAERPDDVRIPTEDGDAWAGATPIVDLQETRSQAGPHPPEMYERIASASPWTSSSRSLR